MSVFGGGDSGWRKSTPGQYMLDVVATAGSFGDSFSKAFSQASNQKQQGQQFDAKMAEEKRQFDTLNAMPASESGQPAWQRESNEMMNGPSGAPATNGATGAWQKFDNPDHAVASVWGSSDMTVANKVVQQITKEKPGWFMFKGFTDKLNEGLKSVATRDRIAISSENAANHSLANQIAARTTTAFNNEAAKLDPRYISGLRTLPYNEDGSVSPAQWKYVGDVKEAMRLRSEQERLTKGLAAVERGDQRRTVISEKGVTETFTPADAKEGVKIEPKETTLSDGSRIVFNPRSGSFRFMEKEGREKEFTMPQLKDIASHLLQQDKDDDNGKRISSFLGSVATNQIGKLTPPKTASTTNAPVTNTPVKPKDDPLGLFK